MLFRQLFDAASCTYSYLIADEASHEAVLIDPVLEQVERDLRLIREHNLALKYTLETHVHADHLTGAAAIKRATGAQTAVSRDCHAQGYDLYLKDGDVVLFGRDQILVIATPGHTPGSVCYLWRDRLFTGDTLLIGGCGRTDFQNGSAEALWDSVTARLFALDEQVLVYPGHDYKGRRVSTIGEEKRFNPRFAGKTREEFLALMNNLGLPMPAKIHEAVPANLVGGLPAEISTPPEPAEVLSVSPRQLAQKLSASANVRILDVRTPEEFAVLRIPGAINVPLDRLDPQQLKAQLGEAATIYCVCQSGVRSELAAERLRRAGFARVVQVDGGTNAWEAARLPLERGAAMPR